MAKQRIIFEQGGPINGDTGERGDGTAVPDGGAVSIKPVGDGERAVAEVFNRPIENIRKRSEDLRDAGEQQLYLQDSDMRWLLVGGGIDGLSPTPWPSVATWSKDGAGAGKGTFTTVEAIVAQPINTPATDIQETVVYPFVDGAARTAGIEFTPTIRAYDLANIIRIIWQAVPVAELASAIVPNYCDGAVTGDAEHILTISIRDDDLTQMANLDTVLTALTADLATMGLGYAYTGGSNMATNLEIADVVATAYGVDYILEGTFEREIHRIVPSAFSDFFTAGGYLEDGDTLSISFDDFVNSAGPPPTGRRQCTPSNSNADVPHGQLFITTRDAAKIPLAIPLCKRIGDDLVWLDGTVVLDGQLDTVKMGEHGYTVNRIINAAGTVLMTVYNDPSPDTQATPVGVTNTSIQNNVEALVRAINEKPSLAIADIITGAWQFTGNVGFHDAAATADYVRVRDTALALSSGGVNCALETSLTIASAATLLPVHTHASSLLVECGTDTLSTAYSSNVSNRINSGVAQILSAQYLYVALAGGTVSTSAQGLRVYTAAAGTTVSGALYGVASGLNLASGSVAGDTQALRSILTLTGGTAVDAYGIYNEVSLGASASVSNDVIGSDTVVTTVSGASITRHLTGTRSVLTNAATLIGSNHLYGAYFAVDNSGGMGGGGIHGVACGVTNNALLPSGNMFGFEGMVDNSGGTLALGDLCGVYVGIVDVGTLTSGEAFGLAIDDLADGLDAAVRLRSAGTSAGVQLVMESYGGGLGGNSDVCLRTSGSTSMGTITAPSAAVPGYIHYQVGNAGSWSSVASAYALQTGAPGSLGTPGKYIIAMHPDDGDASSYGLTLATQTGTTDIWGGIGTVSPSIAWDLQSAGGFAVRKHSTNPDSGTISAANRSFIRLYNMTSNATLHTISGGVDGQYLFLCNVDASYNVTLNKTGNIVMNSATHILNNPGGSALLCYDTTTSKWYMVEG